MSANPIALQNHQLADMSILPFKVASSRRATASQQWGRTTHGLFFI
jgi:hypothetical protein